MTDVNGYRSEFNYIWPNVMRTYIMDFMWQLTVEASRLLFEIFFICSFCTYPNAVCIKSKLELDYGNVQVKILKWSSARQRKELLEISVLEFFEKAWKFVSSECFLKFYTSKFVKNVLHPKTFSTEFRNR